MAANFSRWTGSPGNTKVVQSIAQISNDDAKLPDGCIEWARMAELEAIFSTA